MAKLRVDKIAAPIIKDEYTGSVYFDGTGDYLTIPTSDDFAFGTGDFTIEFFTYSKPDSAGNIQNCHIYEGRDDTNSRRPLIRIHDNSIRYYNDGADRIIGPSLSPDRWYHIAVCRNNGVSTLFVDGVSQGTYSDSIDILKPTTSLIIGSNEIGNNRFIQGCLSNLRVCKGHAVYTGNFTVPTRELEVHTGAKGVVFPAADNRTVLLACQDAYNPLTEATGRHKITGAGALGGVPGQNLVTNGDFHSNSNWDNYVSPTTSEISTDQSYDGTNSWKIVADEPLDGISQTFSSNSFTGRKYLLSGYLYSSTGEARIRWRNGADGAWLYDANVGNGSANVWQRFEVTVTESNGGSNMGVRLTANGSGTFYFDRISVAVVHPVTDANPGLLRKTTTTSTITETTGSVYFDGTGDYLSISKSGFTNIDSGDAFTIESFVYFNDLDNYSTIFASSEDSFTSGGFKLEIYNSKLRVQGTSFQHASGSTTLSTGQWYHFAFSRTSGGNAYSFVDGVLVNSTTNGSATFEVTWPRDVGIGGKTDNTEYLNGYISNLRFCNGHALYTSNFAPPTRELEVHPGPDDDRTVLLCCYDGENIFAEKTGDHIIAAYGDRTSSPTPTAAYSPVGSTTVTPGLTREVNPTAGPTFQGGAGFVSQNWLTLPKGTTAERNPKLSNAVSHGSARAIFGAIQVYPTAGDSIHYATIATFGNTVDFGDLVVAKRYAAGCASKTRGLFGGGSDTAPSPNNTQDSISYITIATTGNSLDFGDLTEARWSPSAFSNATRGIWFSGNTSPANTEVIDYVTISTLGDALDFGDAFSSRRYPLGSTSDTTRGIDAGGHPASDNVIQYVTFASKGDSLDFGDLMQGVDAGCGGVSNGTRGVFAGGYNPTQINTIQYITIQSMGNSKDFGDMTSTDARHGAAAESSTRGLFTHGGYPSRLNTIDAITIATTGNAVEFGDIIDIGGNDGGGDSGTQSGFSNGHGGLG